MVLALDDRAPLFALCHEMGNLVGAIRLQTHLLDQEMTPRDLVVARSEIDVLGARVSALLALVRPLEDSGVDFDGTASRPGDVLAVVEHGLETLLVPGVEVEFDRGGDGAPMPVDRNALQALVTSFVHLAVEQVRPAGRVRVTVDRSNARVALVIEDDGPIDAPLAAWRDEPLRARTLVAAIGERILSGSGGGLDTASSSQGSRVAIWVPEGEAC